MALRTILKKNARSKHVNKPSQSATWFKGFSVLLLTLSFVSGLAFSYNYFFTLRSSTTTQASEEGPIADPCQVDPSSCDPNGGGNEEGPIADPCQVDPSLCNPGGGNGGGGEEGPIADPCQQNPNLPGCNPNPPVEPPTPTPEQPTPPPVAKVRIFKYCTTVENGVSRDCAAAPVMSGAAVRYEVAVQSFGNANAQEVRVIDDYPESQIGSFRDFNRGTLNTGSKLAWDYGTRNSGSTIFASYTATVTAPAGSTVTNTATVTSSNDTSTGDDSASVTFQVLGNSNMRITKTCIVPAENNRACNASPVKTGSAVRYTLDIKNTTDVVAKNVKVVDDYPETMIGSLRDFSIGTLNTGSKLAWDFGDIAAGASRNFSYTATVTVAGPATVKNTAAVFATNETDKSDNVAQYSFQVPAPEQPKIVNVSITKTCIVPAESNRACNASPVKTNANVKYTLEVKNTTNVIAKNVKVVDDYPETMIGSLRDFSPGTLDTGSKLAWDIGELAASASRSMSYTATVKILGPVSVKNTAIVSADNDSNPNDNKAEYTFQVPAPEQPNVADVSITKTCIVPAENNRACNASPVQNGKRVEYTLTITASGNTASKDVKVVDDYDETLLKSIENFVNGTAVNDKGTLTWTIGNMNTKDVKVLKYNATVNTAKASTIKNVAVVSSSNDSNAANNKAEYTFATPDAPERDIALEKLCFVTGTDKPCNASDSTLKSGDIVTYVLRVTNTGKADLAVETLVDTYDSKIASVTNIIPEGTWDAKAFTVTWKNLGTLKSAETKSYKFDAKLGEKAVPGSMIKNVAVVTAQDGLTAKATYDFTLPTQAVVAPPSPRTGALDTVLVFVFVLSLSTGAYFFFNSGKVAQAFGGSKGKF